MQSFNHDPKWNPEDTGPYLHNPVLGGTTFYHVSKGEGCKFDKSMLTFFGLTKGYVQRFFGIHPDSHRDDPLLDIPKESNPYFTICEVRFRNLSWFNIFNIANYIKSLDDSILNAEIDDEEAQDSYPYNYNQDRGEMHPVELTIKGKEIEEHTGFPIEGYSWAYFKTFRELTGRQLIAVLNEQGFGTFYGFLEDELTDKQPLCDDGDYECMSKIWNSRDLIDSDSPLTLALDFRLGKQIIVELIRYEVVDQNGRIVYKENLEDRTLGTEARKFYPGRKNPQNLPIYVNNLGVHTNSPIPLYHATTAADAIIEEGFKTPDELPRGSFGLGSSGMGLISMTGDPRYAEAICVHMATHARIGIGDLRWSDLMADFRRVSPKRYQAIVDGTDLKARNLIHVLKVMNKGQVPVSRGMFGEDMSLSLNPERYELVSMEEYVEYRRDYCISKNLEHLIDAWTNPAKSTLAELYNELLWINDGTIENPVGDSDLWTRFLGQDLSILDQIAYVRVDLKSGMRIVSRNNSVDMPSVFYSRSGKFSVDEYNVQKLKRGEDLYARGSWGGYRAPTPLPESETGLTFDVDSEFVDRVPAEDYNKFAIYLRAEDEFRLPAPRDQLTPAVLEGTAMDILEVLPDLWQGKDVTCFYPHIGDKRKTLRDNLWS